MAEQRSFLERLHVRNEDFEGAGYFFDPSQYAMHMRDYGPLPKDKDAMAKWLGNN